MQAFCNTNGDFHTKKTAFNEAFQPSQTLLQQSMTVDQPLY